MIKVIAAGMPASGKSTFIAALTHLLTAEQVRTELRLAKLSEDEGHLSRLEEAWLAVSKLDRTKKSSEQWVSFQVADTETNVESELLVPDLRGELFGQPATVGRCQRRLWEALLDCDGLLIFTNADAPIDDLMIDDVSRMAGWGSDREGADSSVTPDIKHALLPAESSPETPAVSKFRADDMPEEAKLVELLQAMNRPSAAPKRRRLALIVSAWDVVEGHSPQEWISINRPMLHQFLKHTPALWEVRFYGVSAQGGDLPRDQGRLRAVRVPGERVRIVGPEIDSHDLTLIVRWLASHAEPSDA